MVVAGVWRGRHRACDARDVCAYRIYTTTSTISDSTWVAARSAAPTSAVASGGTGDSGRDSYGRVYMARIYNIINSIKISVLAARTNRGYTAHGSAQTSKLNQQLTTVNNISIDERL